MRQHSTISPAPAFLTFIAIFISQIVLFQILYITKRQLFPAPIIFYEGLQLCVIAFILGGLLLCLLARTEKFPTRFKEQWIQAAFAALIFNYAFMITIPALLDRSISILMVGAVSQAGSAGLSPAEINQKFLDVYVDGTYQIDRRIKEQIDGGDMAKKDERVVITPKGMFIEDVNLTLTRLFNIEPRYVLARK